VSAFVRTRVLDAKPAKARRRVIKRHPVSGLLYDATDEGPDRDARTDQGRARRLPVKYLLDVNALIAWRHAKAHGHAAFHAWAKAKGFKALLCAYRCAFSAPEIQGSFAISDCAASAATSVYACALRRIRRVRSKSNPK
jgi:hypothetical protein